MKLFTAPVICVGSIPTVSTTGVAEALSKFKVTPGIAPVIVLLTLLKGTPSILSEALAPPTGALKVRLVVLFGRTVGLRANAPALPVAWLDRARREPLASATTLAVTPQAPALL